ncbi:MAG TPA: hypothetical protein VFC19_16580 [Candidatus Limnocylindrales bacterium]|nr:hypothetical protein [Candidatus Limnocylindrales bacterium]
MRTSRYLAIAVIAATLLATPAIAQADPGTAAIDVLTYGSLGGPNVVVGDGLSATLKSGTMARFTSTASGPTGVFCSVSNFAGTVGSNPAAGGAASGSVSTLDFSSCTTNITGVTSVLSIVVDNRPYNVSIDSPTKVATVTPGSGPIHTTIKLRTIFFTTITCFYAATGTITGTSSNADNSLVFTNQQFTKQTGSSSLCFANAFWTSTYAPVVDSSQAGSPAVFVN